MPWMSVTIAAAHAYAEARRGRGATPAPPIRPSQASKPRACHAGRVWWSNMLGIGLLVALLVVAGRVLVGHG